LPPFAVSRKLSYFLSTSSTSPARPSRRQRSSSSPSFRRLSRTMSSQPSAYDSLQRVLSTRRGGRNSPVTFPTSPSTRRPIPIFAFEPALPELSEKKVKSRQVVSPSLSWWKIKEVLEVEYGCRGPAVRPLLSFLSTDFALPSLHKDTSPSWEPDNRRQMRRGDLRTTRSGRNHRFLRRFSRQTRGQDVRACHFSWRNARR
jgi:hypothetical protein